MRKTLILVLFGSFMLSSCIAVNTAGKVVKTAGKVAYKGVKGVVKGVSWAVKKADGKINEKNLNGTWKLVGVYNGTFEEFENDSDPDNALKQRCGSGNEVIVFNAKKERFKPVHCDSEKENWVKYKFNFGKNPMTKEKENYIKFNNNNYITIINATGKNMVLEGSLIPSYAIEGGKLYLFEKK